MFGLSSYIICTPLKMRISKTELTIPPQESCSVPHPGWPVSAGVQLVQLPAFIPTLPSMTRTSHFQRGWISYIWTLPSHFHSHILLGTSPSSQITNSCYYFLNTHYMPGLS